ncbi:MAG: GTPase Era [Gammaproteobacteria bacterium]|jgi:GTP-binding protein Era|nr:GTPase Era [Gammaproteobacteria bacterium]
MSLPNNQEKCGTIAIVGRPNVGKSTLLNHLLGQKISITCKKPQTTRHQILGIKTEGEAQYIFVDTPGMHQNQGAVLNKHLNRAAFSALHDVDAVLWLIEPKWTLEEDWIFERLKTVEQPIVLAINKIDELANKSDILPLMERLETMRRFVHIIPISARKGLNLPELLESLKQYLPEQPFLYAEDEITNKPVRFLVSEIIREKLMRFLGEELPYAVSVEVELFKETQKLTEISAVIYVERASQKGIVIGDKGSKLKEIGTEARRDIEKLLDTKVMLRLWVKIKENWRDDEQALNNLGY